jgi:hypothetical protein
VPNAIAKQVEALNASIRAHKWIWAAGGGVGLVAAVAAVVVFGGFLGPSGRTVCEIARFEAVQYGAVPTDAALQGSGKASKIKGGRECTLTSGDDTYIATAQLVCKDVSKDLALMKLVKAGKPVKDAKWDDLGRCVLLYAVERSDGLALYQKRALPDDDEGNPIAPGANPSPADNAGTAPAAPDEAAAPPDAQSETAESPDVVVAQPGDAPQQ